MDSNTSLTRLVGNGVGSLDGCFEVNDVGPGVGSNVGSAVVGGEVGFRVGSCSVGLAVGAGPGDGGGELGLYTTNLFTF